MRKNRAAKKRVATSYSTHKPVLKYFKSKKADKVAWPNNSPKFVLVGYNFSLR